MSVDGKSLETANIFVARQPIFDPHHNVFAYELLFRSGIQEYAPMVDDEYATLKLISNSLVIGLNRLTSGKRAFINFNRQLLLSRIPRLFPRELVAIEILERVFPDERVIAMCEKMKEDGYLMVLDDFVFEEQFRPLVELADIIKIDFQAASPTERREIFEKARASLSPHLLFLAEKIETREQYEEALTLGYTYFQGFFFQRPDIVTTREIPGSKLHYLQILNKICEPDFPIDEIENILKHDISLTYKLLRFINSASYGFKVTVRSVRHALALLGKREVKKWLSIIALSGIAEDKPLELMHSLITRARFCEAIAQSLEIREHPTDYFFMGMFSMADACLDRPMDLILSELPLEPIVKDALLGKKIIFAWFLIWSGPMSGPIGKKWGGWQRCFISMKPAW